MPTYKTFLRSCITWQQFARTRQITQHTRLSYEQARALCQEYNRNRTARQIKRGTKMEFTQED